MAKKTLRAKCLEAAQKLARISAANDNGYCQCVSCDPRELHSWGHWKEMDGGHFIPKGSSSYHALDWEFNIHPQHKKCNMWGMRHGSAEAWYTIWMNNQFGTDFVEQMLRDKKKIKKFYAADYREMLADFNEQIKFHKKRLGEL
tara:strand:+ start:29 stop:460 length:432 start_codon:yes stop_codon:yes gene_type:complete